MFEFFIFYILWFHVMPAIAEHFISKAIPLDKEQKIMFEQWARNRNMRPWP